MLVVERRAHSQLWNDEGSMSLSDERTLQAASVRAFSSSINAFIKSARLLDPASASCRDDFGALAAASLAASIASPLPPVPSPVVAGVQSVSAALPVLDALGELENFDSLMLSSGTHEPNRIVRCFDLLIWDETAEGISPDSFAFVREVDRNAAAANFDHGLNRVARVLDSLAAMFRARSLASPSIAVRSEDMILEREEREELWVSTWKELTSKPVVMVVHPTADLYSRHLRKMRI